jgi:hypothetical protein
MKVYQCDACGIIIKDPYEAKMKEFSVVCDSDMCGVFPVNLKSRMKVHLCEECYQGLHIIAEMKKVGESQ